MNTRRNNAGENSAWTQLWGKTCQDAAYHPLICHMFDVAAVAGQLWDDHLGAALRGRLERSLGSSSVSSFTVLFTG